jgi:hypothetical protein
MVVTYEALAIGIVLTVAVCAVAIFFWRRLRAIERRLSKIHREINGLHIQESRRLVMELNANSRIEALNTETQDASVDVDRGEIVQLRKQSLAPAPSPA